MKETAQRVALSTLVVIAIVAVALALWKLKLVLALVFLAFILAAALRPGIERLARAGIPRGLGLGSSSVVALSTSSPRAYHGRSGRSSAIPGI